MLKKVLESISITPTDTDSTIADKLSERIGRKIKYIEWVGESGSGVRGFVYLEVAGGGEPEKIRFRAQAKTGVGGVFELGDWIIPYVELGYNHISDALVERLEKKLATDGNLDKKVY
jgi:hypothetical protein